MSNEKQIICLAPNFPNYKQDCTEQCDDCKRFQYNMENPVKISKEEREEMERNYREIMKKAKL